MTIAPEWCMIDNLVIDLHVVDLTKVPPLRDSLAETQDEIFQFCDEYGYLRALGRFARLTYPRACRRVGCNTPSDAALIAALYGWTATKLIYPLNAIRAGQPCPIPPLEA